MTSFSSVSVRPFSFALLRWNGSCSLFPPVISAATVMRLRSRDVNSFRSQTSPNKTSSVSATSFGAKSPNVFFILLSLFESGICSSFDSLLRGHQLQCCRTRLRGYHRVNIRCAVSLVLRLISSIYLVIELLIIAAVHIRRILRYPSNDNASLGPPLCMPEPSSFTATACSHLQLITDANDPDNDGLLKRAILLESGKLQFICGSNSFEVIACPVSHCIAFPLKIAAFILISPPFHMC